MDTPARRLAAVARHVTGGSAPLPAAPLAPAPAAAPAFRADRLLDGQVCVCVCVCER